MPASSPVFGIVPAGGRGSRIAGLRWHKALFPIGWEDAVVDGIPCRRPRAVASRLFDGMLAAGAERLFVVVGDGGEVMRYFGPDRDGTPIAYLYQEQPRGGAFAIDLARPWLPPEHTILFGMPDTIVDPPNALVDLLAHHRDEAADLTLALFPTDRPSSFGMVRLDGTRPIEIVDKPAQTDLRYMWGLACWSQRLTALQPAHLAAAHTAREAVPGDLFVAALQAGLRVRAVLFDNGRYTDVGTPAELNRALNLYGGDDA